MKQKLLTFLLLFSAFFYAESQTISIIGDFNSWSSDVEMETTDNENYTLTAHTFTVTGGVKFRENFDWANNWGASSFPSGTATSGGANIPVPAGTYDIAFNITTGAYSFTNTGNFEDIGFIGGFNDWFESVSMTTADGENYSRLDFYFQAPEVKFRKDNSWEDSWGGDSFPSGTAVYNGNNIPLTNGFYNVFFNLTSLDYDFQTVPVTMIGPAVQDWDTEIVMNTEDGGISFTAENVTLNDGDLKFRSNLSWTLNWGGTTFPSGTAAPNSVDETPISVVAGTYNVTFNRLTLEYNFDSDLSIAAADSNSFKVYPNPSNTLWNITSSSDLIEKIILTDITGKVIQIYEPGDSVYSIQNTGLPKGLYMAKVITNKSERVVKLIKS